MGYLFFFFPRVLVVLSLRTENDIEQNQISRYIKTDPLTLKITQKKWCVLFSGGIPSHLTNSGLYLAFD